MTKLYEEDIQRLGNRGNRDQFAVAVAEWAIVRVEVRPRHHTPAKAELARLFDPEPGLRDSANLAAKADLSENGGGLSDRTIP
jgi:hypothetical protein